MAIATVSVDIALWPRVIANLQNGQYFGQFHLVGQPFDVILEVLYLVLLTLPMALPAAWVLNRSRKLVMRPRRKSESVTP
ncbi:MAG: hypothetical protein WC655_08410 [Candidatus Hydrogenedentales bacterium]